jgi:lysine N6-hydroxylase
MTYALQSKVAFHGLAEALDLVGVGIGPANLSLAALLDPVQTISRCFFERSDSFSWHGGQLLPEAELQQVYVKDLVSLVAPSSRFSFISYLHDTGRIYAFLNARFPSVMRQEFNQYLQWASASLKDLQFGEEVASIKFDHHLVVETSRRRVTAKAVVLGTGLTPNIPDCAKPYLGETIFHGSEFAPHAQNLGGRSVVIVGGGQTGAETFLNLIARDKKSRPRKVVWLSRRSNFLPLDDSPFVNEQFSPIYSDYFYSLGHEMRSRLLAEQKLASDGISASTLARIYQRLYELRFLHEATDMECHLLPFRDMTALTPVSAGWLMECREVTTGVQESVEADVIVLSTGFEYRFPECLSSISCRLSWGRDGFTVRPDFSIEWDGPQDLRIYVQNASRSRRGVADPNLSLLSWRSATIINSIADRVLYPFVHPKMLVTFGASAPPALDGDSEVSPGERLERLSSAAFASICP